MERIGNKVSYIKKPFAKNSFVAAGLAAAALGFCSIITAVSSVVYGIFAMMEKEKNYILAKICLAAAGILLLVWALMIVFAL